MGLPRSMGRVKEVVCVGQNRTDGGFDLGREPVLRFWRGTGEGDNLAVRGMCWRLLGTMRREGRWRLEEGEDEEEVDGVGLRVRMAGFVKGRGERCYVASWKRGEYPF